MGNLPSISCEADDDQVKKYIHQILNKYKKHTKTNGQGAWATISFEEYISPEHKKKIIKILRSKYNYEIIWGHQQLELRQKP